MKKLITLFSALFLAAIAYSQTVIWEEDFDSDAIGDGLYYYNIDPPGVQGYGQTDPASGKWTTGYGFLVLRSDLVFSVQSDGASGQLFEIANVQKSSSSGNAKWFSDTIAIPVAVDNYKASVVVSWDAGITSANDYIEIAFTDGGTTNTTTLTGADLAIATSPLTVNSPLYDSKDDIYITISAVNTSGLSIYFDSVRVEEIVLEVPLTDIYDIQYTTDPGDDGTYPSPMLDQTVHVQGTGTGVRSGGYYSQQVDGFDGDNALPVDNSAWTGIYVNNTLISPSEGDIVDVTGVVKEVLGKTEILSTGINASIIGSGDAIIPNMIYGPLEEKYESVLITARSFRVVQSDIDNGTYPNVASIIGIGEGLNAAFTIYVDKDLNDLDVFPSNKDKLFDYIYGVCNYYSNSYRISPRDITDFSTSGYKLITSLDKNSANAKAIYAFGKQIVIQSESTASVSIFNLSGQQVTALNVQNGRTEVQMPSGVYIVKLNNGNTLMTEKVVVN